MTLALKSILLALVMAGSAVAADWPLITVRMPDTPQKQLGEFERICQIAAAHPGSCDEYWLAIMGEGDRDGIVRQAEELAKAADVCRKYGIRVGYQQGLTIGHDSKKDPMSFKGKPGVWQYPDDAWQVNAKGQRMSIFCPRSPERQEYMRFVVRTVVEKAKVESYWLDDDLRLGVSHAEGCFCDRCLKAFGEKRGTFVTREELARRLFNRNVANDPIRAEWIAFNAESLGLFAAAAREGVDAANPACRLAYQAVWSDTIYTGPDYRLILEAISGTNRWETGIRPGACYYHETTPMGMVHKCLSVSREAERCKAYGIVKSVTYELECIPRISIAKTPEAKAVEGALALASGANGLAVYDWCGGSRSEPLSYYEEFAETFAAWRPYFKALAAISDRTRLGGVARFIGSAAATTPDFDLRDGIDMGYATAGIPVTVAESGTKVWYVTEKSVREMGDGDLDRLLSGGAVMGAPVRKALEAKCGAGRVADGFENRVFAEIPHLDAWPGYNFEYRGFLLDGQRQAILDALDKVSGGRMPVRCDRTRPLRILPRLGADGTTRAVTVLNCSIGSSRRIALRVRNAAGARAVWHRPCQEPVTVAGEAGTIAGERVFRLPDLSGWEIGTLVFVR